MPEGPELEAEALKETIDKEIERHEEPFLRWIALSTALLATRPRWRRSRRAAVNEGLVLKTEATRLARAGPAAGGQTRLCGVAPGDDQAEASGRAGTRARSSALALALYKPKCGFAFQLTRPSRARRFPGYAG
jgi:hypothetical protein